VELGNKQKLGEMGLVITHGVYNVEGWVLWVSVVGCVWGCGVMVCDGDVSVESGILFVGWGGLVWPGRCGPSPRTC